MPQFLGDHITTEAGDRITTESGDELVTEGSFAFWTVEGSAHEDPWALQVLTTVSIATSIR